MKCRAFMTKVQQRESSGEHSASIHQCYSYVFLFCVYIDRHRLVLPLLSELMGLDCVQHQRNVRWTSPKLRSASSKASHFCGTASVAKHQHVKSDLKCNSTSSGTDPEDDNCFWAYRL